MALAPIGLEGVFDIAQSFIPGANQYIAILNTVKGLTSSTADEMTSSFGSGLMGGIFIALGEKVVEFAGMAVSALGDFGEMIISNVAELQKLSIALETLTAIELFQTGQAKDMTEATIDATDAAANLKAELAEISIISPFEYKDILSTFRMAMAFGVQSEQALKLTQALTDMTAGMGLSNQMLRRLVYNFGQMNRIGKISMRDVRDLAMAGMDLAKVLKSTLNMSIAETNAALASGSIAFTDVTDALIKYSTTLFSGAAAKASRTLPGLVSSFHDIIFFASQDIAGKGIQTLTDSLGGLLDLGIKIQQSGVLKLVGAGFQLIADQAALAVDKFVVNLDKLIFGSQNVGDEVQTALSRVTAVVDSFISGAAGKAVDTALSAFEWGANIIFQFAAGMITAMSTALTTAMNAVGNMLGFFLSGQSPPRVAPYIDVWGASAMNEFLKGFTKADFSIFSDVSSQLSSALKDMVASGGLGAGDASGIFASLTTQLSSAIKSFGITGDVDQNLFSSIAASMGEMGDELVGLVKAEFDFAKATIEAKKAVDALNLAQQTQTKLEDKLILEKMKYNDMIRKGASKAQLDAQLDLINATDGEREANLEKIKTAEDNKVVADDNLAVMREQLDLQKQLISQLGTLRDLYFQEAEAAKKAGGGGVGVPKVPEIPGAGKGKAGAGRFDKSLSEKMDEQIARLTGNLETKWAIFVENIKKKFADSGLGELFGIGGDDYSGTSGKQYGKQSPLEGALANLTTSFTTFSDTVDLVWNDTIKPFLDGFNVDGGTLATTLGEWAGWLIIVVPLLEGFDKTFPPMLNSVQLLTGALGLALIASTLLSNWIKDNVAPQIKDWKEKQQPLIDKIILLKDEVVKFADSLQLEWDEHIKPIFTDFGTKIQEVWDKFQGWIDWLAKTDETAGKIAEDIVQGLIDGLMRKFPALQKAWNLITSFLPKDLEDETETDSPSKLFFRIGEDILAGLQGGLNSFNPVVPAPVMMPTYSNSTVQNSYNFGGNNINNGMDLAQLTNVIRQVIQSEVGV